MKNQTEQTETTTKNEQLETRETVPFFARKLERPALVVQTGVKAGGGAGRESLEKRS